MPTLSRQFVATKLFMYRLILSCEPSNGNMTSIIFRSSTYRYLLRRQETISGLFSQDWRWVIFLACVGPAEWMTSLAAFLLMYWGFYPIMVYLLLTEFHTMYTPDVLPIFLSYSWVYIHSPIFTKCGFIYFSNFQQIWLFFERCRFDAPIFNTVLRFLMDLFLLFMHEE